MDPRRPPLYCPIMMKKSECEYFQQKYHKTVPSSDDFEPLQKKTTAKAVVVMTRSNKCFHMSNDSSLSYYNGAEF